MVRLKINDRWVEVPEGTSVLDAIFHAGYDVPYFCSERHLSPIGACRMCLVKVGAPRKDKSGEWIKDEDGNPKIFWFPKLMASCTLAATEGMVVDTLADEVKKAQAGMVEFTLLNHPLDCPICDKGGACELQDRAYEYGLFGKYYTETQNGLKSVQYTRFEFDRRHVDKHKKLSEFVVLDRERCIICKRCVRYFEEVPGQEVLDFIERGVHTFIGSEEYPLPAGFSGNITDICPVGALLDLTARFRARNWEFESTPTVDMNDASGALVWVDARSGQIERVRARENPETNEIWISDAARFGHAWAREDRLRDPLVRKDGVLQPVSVEEALEHLKSLLGGIKGAEVGLYLSGDATLEEAYAFVEAAKALKTPHLDFEGRTAVAAGSFAPATYRDLLEADFSLVIGDPTEEMPILHLRLQEFLKGIKPAPRFFHGTPIADLQIKERMPRNKEKLAAFAPYRTAVMEWAAWQGTYAPGSAGAMLAALEAHMNGKRPPEVPGVPAETLRAVATRFLEAKKRILILGAEVLDDPEAAEAALRIARGKGALVFAMTPAAGARGFEAVGLWPEKGGAAFDEAGPAVVFASGATPVAEVLEKARVSMLHLSRLDPIAARYADVIFPAKTFYEKSGFTVNAEGRLLELAPAPVAPLGALDAIEALALLLEALGKKPPVSQFDQAHERLLERYRLPKSLDPFGWLWQPKPRLPVRAHAGADGGLYLRPSMWKHRQLADARVRAALGATRLSVHPKTAAEHGLVEGATVEVETPYGTVQASVAFDAGLPEGFLYLPAYGRGTGRRVPFRLLVPAGGEA